MWLWREENHSLIHVVMFHQDNVFLDQQNWTKVKGHGSAVGHLIYKLCSKISVIFINLMSVLLTREKRDLTLNWLKGEGKNCKNFNLSFAFFFFCKALEFLWLLSATLSGTLKHRMDDGMTQWYGCSCCQAQVWHADGGGGKEGGGG